MPPTNTYTDEEFLKTLLALFAAPPAPVEEEEEEKDEAAEPQDGLDPVASSEVLREILAAGPNTIRITDDLFPLTVERLRSDWGLASEAAESIAAVIQDAQAWTILGPKAKAARAAGDVLLEAYYLGALEDSLRHMDERIENQFGK